MPATAKRQKKRRPQKPSEREDGEDAIKALKEIKRQHKKVGLASLHFRMLKDQAKDAKEAWSNERTQLEDLIAAHENDASRPLLNGSNSQAVPPGATSTTTPGGIVANKQADANSGPPKAA